MEEFIINAVSDQLKQTQIVSNLSRQKMLVMTLCSLLRCRSVVFAELAVHLNDHVKTASNETRIRDFFREVPFDYDVLAAFTFSFLAAQAGQKIRLTIDRTNWEFRSHSTNILMVIAKWHLALVYLQKGQFKEAQPLLIELQNNTRFGNLAKEALNKGGSN